MAKILVIEDEQDIALVLAKRLSNLGHKVVVGNDAYQGLSLARREAPDLIILDLMLPAGGGFGVLERIRAMPNIATTPIIVATALHSEDMKDKVLAAGADAFFEKPYDFEKLGNLIRDLTQKSGSS
jgi:DNA-binding response OmpR family regulator